MAQFSLDPQIVSGLVEKAILDSIAARLAQQRADALREAADIVRERAVPLASDNTSDQRLVGTVLRGLAETLHQHADRIAPTTQKQGHINNPERN